MPHSIPAVVASSSRSIHGRTCRASGNDRLAQREHVRAGFALHVRDNMLLKGAAGAADDGSGECGTAVAAAASGVAWASCHGRSGI